MRRYTPYNYLITVFTLCMPVFVYAAALPPIGASDDDLKAPPPVRLKRKNPPKKEAPPYPIVPHPGRDSGDETQHLSS